MRVVTIVSLGASAVLGLGALVVAKTVLPNTAAAKPAGAQVVAGVPVVVAAKPLKYGDKLDASMLATIRLPQDAVPEGAFSTPAAVLSQDNGGPPVVLVPLAAKEPFLAAKLSGPGARPSVAAEIGEGMRAYTIKVNDVSGVGGHALPGDRVDVVLNRDTTPSGETRNFVSEVVIQNVRVLAVDLNADLASNKPAAPTNATLEVTVPDSQKLALAADLGKLSLALRRTGSSEVASAGPVRIGNISAAGGVSPVRVVRAHAPRLVRASYTPGPAMIQIVEGESRKQGSRPSRAPVVAATAPAPTLPAATSGFGPSVN